MNILRSYMLKQSRQMANVMNFKPAQHDNNNKEREKKARVENNNVSNQHIRYRAMSHSGLDCELPVDEK